MKLLADNRVQIKVRNPQQVLHLIPHAEQHADPHTLIVPHGLEEVKILRNLGVKVPAPILHQYDWPGSFTPFAHQRDAAAFMTMYQRCFVLLDMGLGKSMAALWAADWMMRNDIIRRVLILSTLSCLDATWYREIFRNLMHRTSIVMHGTKQQRMAALTEDVDFFIMNHHGMLVMKNELPKRNDIDLVIVDEASMMRNAKTEIYKALQRYIQPRHRLWLLTGKPCPNGPLDAWGLARMVSPSRVPQFYTRWRDETMHQVSRFKWVPKPSAVARMYDALQPAIRYAKADCLDLPPTIYLDRKTELTELQERYFQMMRTRLVLWAAEHKVTAANAAILLGKLLQICAGAMRTDDEQYVGIDASTRLGVLKELVDQSEAKSIVFVPYTGALRQVADFLRTTYGVSEVEVIDGSTSRAQRADILKAFQDTPKPQILLAHPRVAAHGLNLTAAATTVWFSPIHSLDIYDQANERMIRPGQTRTTTIAHIGATSLEWKVYDVLRKRGAAQEEFLELFKQELQL